MNGKSYRYVLSVMDVFSRFVWLRALTSKCSKEVAKELKSIYMEYGPPRVIQSDQGGEFKSAVKTLCRRMDITTICSRPYHPQSQGKVERSHRSLRAKMEYDLIKMGGKGVNWVKSLPTYQRILNNDPKEVLRYKTPFEVYFARKWNSLKPSEVDDEVVANNGKINPTVADRRRRSKHVSQVRQGAHKATDRCDKRMQRAKLRSNPPAKYGVGEKVLVRLSGKAKKKRHIIEARIEKRNLKLQTYKVSYISLVTGKKENKWLPVDDVTSLTFQEEKRKQKAAKLSRRKKVLHHTRFNIVMTRDDYTKVIEHQGFQVIYNPPGDGNCQFAALAHQLNALGIFRSPETMREEIVTYLQNHPVDHEGFPLSEQLVDTEFASWEEYLQYMKRKSTFGDQLTLFAAANLYNINIQITSTLGAGAQHVFHPSLSVPLASVYLGHFAENHGEHYVSLMPEFNNNMGISDADDGRTDVDEGDANNDTGYVEDDVSDVKNEDDNVNSEASDVDDDVGDIYCGTGHVDSDVNDEAGEIEEDACDEVSSSSTHQLLNNDVLELIITITLLAFPFMRTSLKCVNKLFKSTVDKVPCPRVYIPEFPEEQAVISMRKIMMLKGKGSGAVAQLREAIKSPRWHQAWIRLEPLEYGWFAIAGIFWKNGKKA